jgi:hypothetical protein
VKSQTAGWVAGALLVCSCSRQPDPPAAAAPPAPPARDTRLEMYQLQEKCAKDAHDWYKREWEDVPGPNIASTYTNHYNSKLDRCFLIVTSAVFGTDKKTGVAYSTNSKTLLDVLENRDIGVFDQKSSVGQPTQCEVHDVICASADEWTMRVKPYMTE